MQLWSRERWGAEFNIGLRPALNLPVRELWVHHTVTKPSAQPAADMRLIERIDIQRFGTPSYSWVLHPSGIVLEGTGTHKGAHTLNRNSFSFGVSFIGNYEEDTPTAEALDAFVELVRFLIAAGWLAPGDYPSGGHRDVYPTACPGRHLYPLIPDLRRRVAGEAPEAPPQEEDLDMMFVRRTTNGRLYLVSDTKATYMPDPEPDGARVYEVSEAGWGQIARTRYVLDYGQ